MGTTETLRTLLDGPYPETRERVRWWLSEPGNEPVDDLPTEEHRERVLAWARELSSRGRHRRWATRRVRRQGLAGPQRDLVRDARDGRPLAAGQVRRAVRPLRRRDPAPRHRAPPRALPARRRLARAPRLLRDDRDRPRLQRPGAARRPRPTTPTREEFVIHTPDDDARKDYIGNAARDGRMAVVFAQLHAGGEERGVHALLVPIRDEDGDAAAGRAARGLRRQARPQRRRQRPHLVRPRARPAREPARPLRAGRAGRDLLQPDREPDQALLHDDRDADPGPHQRLRRVDQRHQGGADDRRPARAGAAPVRAARASRRRC